MMHAKTLVVDGTWTTIGSMNFDAQSIGFNDEANIIFMDSTLAARMESIFLEDLTRSHEVKLAEIRQRSAWAKLKDWLSAQFQRVL
jgi:cardiolipin synthase